MKTKGEVIYLNHASTGLLPEKARRMMQSVARYQATKGTIPKSEWEPVLAEVRALLASLIGANDSHICLTHNTTEGFQIALESISWKPGDEILLSSCSFPSNVIPWQTRPMQVSLKAPPIEYVPGFEEKILKFVTLKTRCVSIDWVHFITGYRVDLKFLYQHLHSKGILLVIDGMQGVGALDARLIASHCDFFSSGGNKWLLSPWGTGFLYVRPTIIPELRLRHIGWLSLQWESFESFQEFPEMYSGARRWEGGTPNFSGLYAMRESLKFLRQISDYEREREILTKVEFLKQELQKRGCTFAGNFTHKFSSGIVSFQVPDVEMPRLYAGMTHRNIFASFRNNFIRLSPHFFTSWNSINNFLQTLDAILKEI